MQTVSSGQRFAWNVESFSGKTNEKKKNKKKKKQQKKKKKKKNAINLSSAELAQSVVRVKICYPNVTFELVRIFKCRFQPFWSSQIVFYFEIF